jgi:hypothetical protein
VRTLGPDETPLRANETRRRGDEETRRRGDEETRRRGDEETRRRGGFLLTRHSQVKTFSMKMAQSD